MLTLFSLDRLRWAECSLRRFSVNSVNLVTRAMPIPLSTTCRPTMYNVHILTYYFKMCFCFVTRWSGHTMNQWCNFYTTFWWLLSFPWHIVLYTPRPPPPSSPSMRFFLIILLLLNVALNSFNHSWLAQIYFILYYL